MTGAWREKKKNNFLAETGVMYAGKVMWQQPQPPGLHTTVPVVSVPDLDGDKFGDVALVMSDNTQVNMAGTFTCCTSQKLWWLHVNVSSPVQTRMVFLSGKTGLQIGSTVVLSTEAANHVFHRSAAGSDYVLLRKGRHPKQSAVIFKKKKKKSSHQGTIQSTANVWKRNV